MAEMMVAVVILGLGLLMASSTLPVGWVRARELAEYSSHVSTSNAAETTIQLICNVGHPGAPVTSFRGDDPLGNGPDGLGDTFVHPLHLENLLVDDTNRYSIGRIGDYYYADRRDASIESLAGGDVLTPLPDIQVPFGERVFPAMPQLPSSRPEIEHWYDQLSTRRFGWAMFHKLDPVPTGVTQTGYEPRSMTVYLVTLRRPQAGYRYARQYPDVVGGAMPSIFPRALPKSDDVMFPVAWLVTLTVNGNWDDAGNGLPRTGVPSEAIANIERHPLRRLSAQMLTAGSVLIDRHNGNIYTVKQHRFTGEGRRYDYSAMVTLDQEVNVEDVGVATGTPVQLGVDDRREFWIFPPPVEPKRVSSRYPTFMAHQPVVSIEIRQMAFSPQ